MSVYTNPRAFADRVLKRISQPENWTQRAAARTATGAVCPVWDPDAVCWCLIGACQIEAHASKDWNAYSLFSRLLDDKVFEKTGSGGIEFNDNHSHAEVLGKVKEAMEELS